MSLRYDFLKATTCISDADILSASQPVAHHASSAAHKTRKCVEGKLLKVLDEIPASIYEPRDCGKVFTHNKLDLPILSELFLTFSQRAQELIGVGNQADALHTLHEHVTSKRTRNSPIAALEPVMLLFIELCVDLRKGKMAKDGLYNYKNTSQNTNVATIEVGDSVSKK